MRKLLFILAALFPLAAAGQFLNPAMLSIAVKVTETVFDNGGQPWPFFSNIPGVAYNTGGANVAYVATAQSGCTANGSAYRADYINFKTDVGQTPPFRQGCFVQGFSFRYQINISTTGPYQVNFNAANGGAAATITLLLDNTGVATVTIGNTDSSLWNTFAVFSSTAFNATLGNHILTVSCTNGPQGCGDIRSFRGATSSVSSLVAEWRLNAPSISGTTVADASGNGNTANVIGGPLSFGAFGAIFNGSSQYLSAPTAVSGCLSGSICPTPPAGRSWNITADDEFNGSSLDTTFWTSDPDGTGMFGGQVFVHNSTTVTVSGGIVSLVGFSNPPAGTTGACNPASCNNGAVFYKDLPGDGYFEARLKSTPTNYSAFWSGQFSNTDCGGGYGIGVETDIMESFNGNNAQINNHWDGYGSCHQSQGTGSIFESALNFHIWGVWVDATTGLTYYRDGVQVMNLPGPLTTAATTPRRIYLHVEDNSAETPLQVDWFRYYRLTP